MVAAAILAAGSATDMEIVVRAAIVFVFLLLLTRGLRRRTLANMSPFEMILLVVMGDIVQQGITQEDKSVTGGVLAATTFAVAVSALSFATWRWSRVHSLVEGRPIVILRDGVLDLAALKAERMPVEEVLHAARQEGVSSLHEVAIAVLETNGRISFIRAGNAE
jgi:uncharacterized membrane protein YcaP (DUF421 family)